ncbi:MAG TPA: methyltransferase domain-containing protein [Verrucomicrobiae bacterium]|nr:methyltransferase domain-containing protein [Verrucomicrobiae bacterium]
MRIGLWLVALVILWLVPAEPVRLSAAEASPSARPAPAPAPPPPLSRADRAESTNRYEVRTNHSADGIGKFYMGREIAHVITGPGAASWLERPEREAEENTITLVEQLRIKPGSTVADIGAGTGYLSRRLAAKVGPQGQVLAEDIQPEMLKLLNESLAANAITNVRTVLGTITDAKLPPNSVDMAILVDVYHEFDHPYEMMRSIVASLRPQGRIVFVEFRGEDPAVPIKELHKMTEAQVKREMAPWPLRWVETIRVLPIQNIIVFEQAAAP